MLQNKITCVVGLQSAQKRLNEQFCGDVLVSFLLLFNGKYRSLTFDLFFYYLTENTDL